MSASASLSMRASSVRRTLSSCIQDVLVLYDMSIGTAAITAVFHFVRVCFWFYVRMHDVIIMQRFSLPHNRGHSLKGISSVWAAVSSQQVATRSFLARAEDRRPFGWYRQTTSRRWFVMLRVLLLRVVSQNITEIRRFWGLF